MAKPDTHPTVDVRVLYTEGCAATAATVDLVNSVARELGIQVHLQQVLVTSPEQATALKFLGSPTVLVNGWDVDPAARQHTHYGFM
jgi:hypothetical protein